MKRKEYWMGRRYQRLISTGFSDQEADFYANRHIGGRNLQWLIRARKRFMATLTPNEQQIFIDQMDDLYSHRRRLEEEEGDKIYSPELYDEETGENQRKDMVAFWKEQQKKSRLHVK